MTATTQESSLVANATANTLNDSCDDGGTVHIKYFTHDQDGAGDATSSVAVVKLPAGRVRLLLGSSMMYVNWTTSSATLDMGWDSYTGLDGDAVDADPNGLIDGLDVDSAGVYSGEDLVTSLTNTKAGTYLFESLDGVTLRLTSEDTAIVSGDDVIGYIAYAKN